VAEGRHTTERKIADSNATSLLGASARWAAAVQPTKEDSIRQRDQELEREPFFAQARDIDQASDGPRNQ
jgi:hypothetical protein